jgi:hypothetical protein
VGCIARAAAIANLMRAAPGAAHDPRARLA